MKTYKGLWGGVAGYVEENEEPYDTALKEIREEVGMEKGNVRLIKRGESIRFTDIYEGKRYEWITHPFVFNVEKKRKVQIDWEHTEYKWIPPEDISKYDSVPHLKEIVHKIFVSKE